MKNRFPKIYSKILRYFFIVSSLLVISVILVFIRLKLIKNEGKQNFVHIYSDQLQPLEGSFNFYTDGANIYCYDAPDKPDADVHVIIDNKSYARIIQNDDLTKIKLIESQYISTPEKVYYMCQELPDSDPQTFKVFNPYKGYASSYSKDKTNVYYLFKKLNQVDSASFRAKGLYGIDKNSVFYTNWLLEEADRNSFADIDRDYAKDKNYVFFEGKILIGADTTTFRQLEKEYFLDKNNVYYKGNLIEGMDPKTTSFLGYLYYAKDKNFLYFGDKRIEGSDPKTVGYFGSYIKDKTGIYSDGKRLTGYDPDSVTYVGFLIYKDKDKVFRDGMELTGADPQTFQIVEKYGETGNNYYNFVWSKDASHVYYGTKLILKADAYSFRIEGYDENNNCIAKDSHCTFRMGEIIECSN